MKHSTVIAAVVAVVVGVALQVVYMRRFEAEVSGGVPLTVVVAASDLHAGDTLTTAMLSARKIPSAYVDLRHIRARDNDSLLGETLSTAVRAGESLLWSDLQMDPTRSADLAARVRPGMRAVTLHAGGDQGFAELLRPGDRVDVLLSSTTVDPMARGGGSTTTLLENVLVLAVGTDLGTRVTSGKNLQRGARHVTVSASPAGAQRLAQAQQHGRLTLTLRNPDDAVLVQEVERASSGETAPVARSAAVSRPPVEIQRVR